MPQATKLGIKEYNAAYYRSHRAKIIAATKKYALNNNEIVVQKRKAHYERNREVILTQQKHYAAANKTKIVARCAAYYLANQDKIKDASMRRYLVKTEELKAYQRNRRSIFRDEFAAYNRVYRINNADKLRRKAKQYRQSHPDKIREIKRQAEHERRARKLGAASGDSALIRKWNASWRKQKRARCYWCGSITDPKKCHSDHIHALVRGGAHAIENLCVSCSTCNLRKNAKKLSVWNKEIESPVLAL